MPGKVRVFISSTMEDLANEREAVVEQVTGLGLEPVNAEGLLPNGATSWALLADEIASCHIFVLLMGDRYGWIPTSGPGAGQDKSVTHLETDLARASDLPILPFVKRLKYGTASKSKDAKRRDKFRKEIGDWKDGFFRAEFDRARDLGRHVRDALVDVFQDTYLKSAVRKIDAASNRPADPGVAASTGATTPTTGVALELTLAGVGLTVSSGKVAKKTSGATELLVAGAGFSISAGYPTASALAEVLGRVSALA